MKRGKFISLEGGEGAGKSTQAQLLADELRKRGLEVILTREPGGTAGAEAIRALLLAAQGDGWNPRAEALLFAAARSDHVERLIRPALERGAWVVCDRFIDSSRAYQGAAMNLGDVEILSLHAFGSEGLMPDLTVLIEIEPNIAEERLRARDAHGTDRIGGREVAYHQAVGKAFSGIAAQEGVRVVSIDGAGTPASIHERIMAAVRPLFGPAR